MTEAEYGDLRRFQDLPLYEANEPRAETLTELGESASDYVHVIEAIDYEDARAYLMHQDRFEPKGGVRYANEAMTAVYAYFWERRTGASTTTTIEGPMS